jgi:hypothetical protein
MNDDFKLLPKILDERLVCDKICNSYSWVQFPLHLNLGRLTEVGNGVTEQLMAPSGELGSSPNLSTK